MTFRPLLWPSVIAGLGIVIAISLGMWQLQRLAWKADLLSAMAAARTADPVPLAAAGAVPWTRVAIRGRFLHPREMHVFAPSRVEGELGVHVVTPFEAEGATVLVDRGFVPERLRDPGARAAGQVDDLMTITGILRPPAERGAFTPADDPARNLWFARDVAAMASASETVNVYPLMVALDQPVPPGGWPKPVAPDAGIRNPHLGYAITWFSLAAVLAAVYLAYHAAQGRLGVRRRTA